MTFSALLFFPVFPLSTILCEAYPPVSPPDIFFVAYFTCFPAHFPFQSKCNHYTFTTAEFFVNWLRVNEVNGEQAKVANK